MPLDPTHQLNRSVCQADFGYSMTLDLSKIVDLNLGLWRLMSGKMSFEQKSQDRPIESPR